MSKDGWHGFGAMMASFCLGDGTDSKRGQMDTRYEIDEPDYEVLFLTDYDRTLLKDMGIRFDEKDEETANSHAPI
jgi:hypothetical protein